MSYPAAHEGAIGIDRDESWLSLDPDMLSTRDLIREMVDRLSFSNLMGQSPAARRISERCQRPRPGDLVAEVSSRHRQDPDSRLKGMGYLVALRDEWVHTDAEWAEVREEWEHRRPVEHDVAYIQYGPAAVDVCRWVNARVVGGGLELTSLGEER